MLSLVHRRFWLLVSVVWIAAVVYGSLKPGGVVQVPEGFDKIEHCGSYCFLALWFTGLYPRRTYWAVAAWLLLLGFGMEVGQYLMHMGRDADPMDMLANTIGVAAGMSIAVLATGGWATRVEAWLNRN